MNTNLLRIASLVLAFGACAAGSAYAAPPPCDNTSPDACNPPPDPPDPPTQPPSGPDTADVLGQQLVSLAAIGVASAGHIAGNFEVTTARPMGHRLSCDQLHVTTRRTRDPNRDMFQLLKSALEKGKPVHMRITNDGPLAAFPGRCSLVGVELD